MLPPVDRSGNPNYTYPPVPQNPTGAPNNAYAVPQRGQTGIAGSPVPTTFPGDPWSVHLGGTAAPSDTVSNRYPDPVQIGQVPPRTLFPEPTEPAQDYWLGAGGRGRDEIQRHSVEDQHATGINEAPPQYKSFAPNPRYAQYPEGGSVSAFQGGPDTIRPTARQNPNTYGFTRPYDQRFERRLDGKHFSMADHRRNYPIFGMSPAKTWRNTSKVDPAPWDANIVDTANGPAFAPAPAIPNYEVPMGSQSFVFGG